MVGPGFRGKSYDPPVAEFLTAEWVAELDAWARGNPVLAALADGEPMTVELRVRDAERDEFVFQAVFAAGEARFTVGSPSAPDLVVLLDAGFAARIRAGAANVQDALEAGGLKVRGDLDALVARAPALAAVGDVFAALREVDPTAGR
jgi:hypothetical protein